MDNDEIRRRRLQRLGNAGPIPRSNSANTSSASTTNSTNSSQPPITPGAAPQSRETPSAPPPPKEASPHAFAPSKPATKPAARSQQRPDVQKFLGLPADETAITWDELLSDKERLSEILLNAAMLEKQPLSHFIRLHNDSERLISDLAVLQPQLKEVALMLGFMCATVEPGEMLYENLGDALLNAALNNRLHPEFVKQFFRLAKDDLLLPDLVHDALKPLTQLKFGDYTTSAAFKVAEYVLAVPEAADLVLPSVLDYPSTKLSILQINDSFLGKVFNAGVSAQGIKEMNFAEPFDSMEVATITDVVRQASPVIELHQSLQFSLVNKLVRQGDRTRKQILQWFKQVLDANHGQLATNRRPDTTSSYVLMLNVFRVLLRLAEPFTTLSPSSTMYKQLTKINRSYFASKSSYDIATETKVMAEENALHNSQNLAEPVSFVTEIFFLTAGFLHFGFNAAVNEYKNESLLRRMTMEMSGLAQEPYYRSLPPPMQQRTMARMKQILVDVKLVTAGVAVLVQLPELMGMAMKFSEFTLAFDVYAAEDGKHQPIKISVPWTDPLPENYASFPEFLLEAPVTAASFVMQSVEFFKNPALSGSSNTWLFDAAVFFMSSPQALRNPYLRSKFVELIFYGAVDIPLTNNTTVPGALSGLLMSSETCRQFLLRALMAVFIDIEYTGRHAQFYEKFSIRSLVASVFKIAWRDPHYLQQLELESQQHPDLFVRFVALLLNDSTYLLDEALGKVTELHKLENPTDEVTGSLGSRESTASANGPTGQPNTERDREQLGATPTSETPSSETQTGEDEVGETEEEGSPRTAEQRAEDIRKSAKNLLSLAKVSMTLLNTFTSTVPAIFATPEIIDRFAVMLNYNLTVLVGSRCRSLKVRNAVEIGFHPREMLTDLVNVYLNLRQQSSFPKAIAKDERSFRDSTWRKAQQILKKFNLLSPIDLENFDRLAKAAQEAWVATQDEEQEVGDDVPDEYLDPLMYTLMENPVTLPTSKVNIDLNTIKTHLLSNPTDPFNRVPLSIADVIPNEALRQEILAFKQTRRAQRRANQDEPMPDAV